MSKSRKRQTRRSFSSLARSFHCVTVLYATSPRSAFKFLCLAKRPKANRNLVGVRKPGMPDPLQGFQLLHTGAFPLLRRLCRRVKSPGSLAMLAAIRRARSRGDCEQRSCRSLIEALCTVAGLPTDPETDAHRSLALKTATWPGSGFLRLPQGGFGRPCLPARTKGSGGMIANLPHEIKVRLAAYRRQNHQVALAFERGLRARRSRSRFAITRDRGRVSRRLPSGLRRIHQRKKSRPSRSCRQ